MKLQPDRLEGVNAINACVPGRITINGQPWTHSVLVPWQGEVCAWDDARPGMVQAEHFERLVGLSPEVVIFGSGQTLRFAPPVVLRSLYERRIGIETMDTAAACRTYNILVGEGRRVVAALLLG
ncbi:MAG: Mth938-like domain-containing protein [Leptothrix sp. (in: b-proteobacteria)]